MTGPSASAIRFEKVTRRYAGVTAIDRLTFDVRAGEMFGLIGPDGAGKTTTIRLTGGLLAPDTGSIRVLGRDPVAEHRAITGEVGYLSQRFSLYGDLTIDENIAFFAEIHGVRRFEPARDRLLDMTQLTSFRARRADRLSGGMKQKLALACTLVHEPRLLLLDEPTTGVDPVSRREFWKLLSEFLSRGLTIVMTTPYLDEAERCARVALLHEGHLLALDEPGNLQRPLAGQILEVVTEPRASPASPPAPPPASPKPPGGEGGKPPGGEGGQPHRGGGGPPIELIARLPGVESVQPFGDRAHVRIKPGAQASVTREIDAALRAAGIPVSGIRPIAASLEDVFIDLITGRHS
jgi:ABC-2 type transport system ATP-binding protein